MERFFNNILLFSVCYFAVLVLDLSFMIFSQMGFLRLVTKPALIILLIGFYASNDDESSSSDFVFTIMALGFFMLANIMTYFKTEYMVIMAASICFILGKVFYICRFSNQRDFNVVQFLPFLAFYLIYMFVVLNLTIDNLGSSLIPILIFLFITLLTVQFAFLRKGAASKSSYQLVLFGIFFLLTADTLSVLSGFYKYWPQERYITMIIYGFAQYLIIMGLVCEKREANDQQYVR